MAETGEFRVGECIVNRARGQIMRPGGTAHLEPRAMDLLVALAERAGRTASRDELIEAVWGHPHVSDEALSRCVSLVRQALGDDRAQPRFVETIPKRGYRLLAPVDGLSHGAEGDKTSPTAVAVLPFLNLSGDPGNEHIADGLTELLINNLASLPSLRVVSRTSSMHYKNTQARLTDIARELNVTRVVEGSVLRSERSLQVVVQLIDPATDLHMFTRTYTRDLADLLRLQNEIAWTVAGEIGASLEPGDRARLPLARPLPPDASESYLRARHFWAQRTPESMAKAMREYEACIAAAPDFAAAHAGLALSLELQAFYGVVAPATVADRARQLAERAYALDPASAEALTAMGALRMIFDFDLAGSEHFYTLAVAANPSYDIARLGLGDCLLFRHDFDAALREIYAAVRVSPFDLGLQRNVGDFLIFAGHFEEAIAQLRHTLDIGPHYWPARCLLAEVLAVTGDAAGAKQQLERVREDIPVSAVHQPEAFVYAALGETGHARKMLEELAAARTKRYVAPFALARGYAMLGDADAAFHWVDQGIAERCPANLGLGIQLGFERLRGDPRFADRLRRIGLTPRS